jgi:ABC-type polysaccharide/polyol phosphate transport system ATPase subunit
MLAMDRVSKRYLLGQGRGARGVLLDLLGHRDARQDLWALRDLSFQLGPGEALGIVGHNGAGKTTTLRLLAGITRPTRGRVQIKGRVACLLNVGAGFHPELTGRENVVLNGVILGLTRAEAQIRYDAIVDFAELDAAFMDTPVKHYSSGMYARLAFSVAAHVGPDVLLVDEVLSVGDATFQDRSFRRMLDFRDRDRAVIIFVSHNLAAVELMCPRTIWLDRGTARAEGRTSDVLRAYLDAIDSDAEQTADGYVIIDRVEVLNAAGRLADCLEQNEAFTVRLAGTALKELPEPVFVVTIRGDHGPLFAGNMHIDGNWPIRLPKGHFSVECGFDAPRLVPGRYRAELKIKQNVRTNFYEPRVVAHFNVGDDRALVDVGGGDVPYRIISGS